MSGQEKKQKGNKALILVEGPSDRTALRNAVSEFLDNYDLDPYFCILDDQCVGPDGGDITSQDYVNSENIERMISRFLICPILRKRGLKEKHVACIIQITDTDGAFVEPDRLIEMKEIPGIRRDYYPEEKTFYYNEDSIYVFNKRNGCQRNETKSANLKYLVGLERIQPYVFTQAQMEEDEETHNHKRKHLPDAPPASNTIPYHIFYFSCNLDHFTCENANLEKYKKIENADEFREQNGDGLEDLKRYLSRHPGTVKGLGYKESWEFLEDGCESLHQHTNLNLLFDMTKEELLRE